MFTLGVALAFLGFVVACVVWDQFLERIPFGWAMFLGLCTFGALVASFRKAAALSSPTYSLLILIWLGLLAVSQAKEGNGALVLWYGLLGLSWCIITIRAVVMRRAAREEQRIRMNRAAGTMRRAVDRQDA